MSGELDRLAAACIFPSFPGLSAPSWVRAYVEDGLGGICLFAYNIRDPEQLEALTASLRDGREDLLIGIDEEGGDVTRLESARGSSYPGNGALGAVDDLDLTERVAAEIGADLRAVGVNLDFAPVADIRLNPANPVIGLRSFGDDPSLVARHVAAFVRGLQGRGVAACAKHFPGHGSTAQDSHLELPVVEGDVHEGLLPFRAAVEAGVRSIMTAHVRVEALGEAPATLNPRVVQALLRDELGYDGLVIADALEMKAVSETYGIERGAVLAVAAGVDALLIGHDLGEEAVSAVHRALVEAVAGGGLTEDRLREAAGRVRRAAPAPPTLPADAVQDRGGGREAARRALRVDGEVALGSAPFVVELRPEANIAAGEAEHSLGAVLAARLPGTRTVVLAETEASGDRVGAPAAPGRPVVVVRDAHRHPWMRELAGSLSPSLVVEVGVPLWRPPGNVPYAATYGGGRVSFEVLADRLLDREAVPA
jgi:beta-N-acetylhexosaminidase